MAPTRFIPARYLALVGACLASSCTLLDPAPETGDEEARTVFEDLIARGQPVGTTPEEFDDPEGNAFDRAADEYADIPGPATDEPDDLDAFSDLVAAATVSGVALSASTSYHRSRGRS